MFAFSAHKFRFSATQTSPQLRKARLHSITARTRRGLALESLEQRAMLAAVPLVTETSPSRGIVPTAAYFDEAGVDWTGSDPQFDDSSWTASAAGGPNGIGAPIGTGAKYAPFASINAASMVGTSNTAFLRIPFTVEDADALSELTLNIRFDDGFIAYINGQEVARHNAAAGYPSFPEKATANVTGDATGFTSFDISNRLDGLTDGTNILAIRGFDRSAISAFPLSQDFVVQATLTAEAEDRALTANDDSVTYDRESPDPIINVLANDEPGDYPINPSTVEIVSPPAHGTATVNHDGRITYSEDPEFVGTDTFTYRVRDTNPAPTPGAEVTPVTVISTTSAHRRLVPTATSNVPSAWRGSAAFDDLAWASGSGGIGYDDAPDYDPYIGAGGDVTATMDGINTSIYARYAFTVLDPSQVHGFVLRMRYDDGFIAYINGVQVAAVNAPVTPVWNSAATAVREAPASPEEFFIPLDGVTLRSGAGANILALQGLNELLTSSDFLLQPELIAETAQTGMWSNEATVTITVTSPGPKAIDDTAATTGVAPVVIPVLDNDTPGDPPNNFPLRPESVRVATPPANGVATVNRTTGEITYQANPGFSGEDAFEYTVRDSAPVGGSTETTSLLPRGSVWKYLDDGSDQGTAWRDTTFNDSAWASGPAELGYGDAPVTQVRCNAQPTPCNTSAPDKFITTYFRHAFDLENPAFVQSLNVLASYDDGAVVYINGIEVARSSNMPSGVVTFQTPAVTDHEGGTFESLASLSAASLTMLRAGTNVIAVEIHQNSATSSDMTFDLELQATVSTPTGRLSNPANVTVSVASTNQPPVAVNDSAQTKVEQPVTINVLANDQPRGALLDVASVTIVAAPTNGTATVLTDGRVTYTPPPQFTGNASFTYTVRDVQNRVSNIATVSIQVVTSVVDAADDLYNAEEDDLLIIPAAFGVLRNDASDEGDVVSATIAEQSTHGTIVLAANGGFEYTPNANFAGEDTFRYRATDSFGTSAEATVTIRVAGTPDAPIALGDVFSTTVNTPLVVFAAPADRHIIIPAESEWRYLDNGDVLSSSWRTPAYDDSAWLVGTGQFGYGDGDETTLINFGDNPNSRPIVTYFRRDFIIDDRANLHRAWVGLLRDDGAAFYVNNNGVNFSNLNSTSGNLALEPVTGQDENTYFPIEFRFADLVSGRNVIAVQVHQASHTSNDMSFDLYLHGDVAGPVTGGVLLNDIDADGDYLTARLVAPPTHGTLAFTADGGFTYTPNLGFVGSDSFTYQATDGERLSEIATVVINVAPSGSMAADINEDGIVDMADVAMVVAGFGNPGGADKHGGDVNGDGIVNLQDAMAVRQAIGEKAPPASAPAAIVASKRDARPVAEPAPGPLEGGLTARANRRAAASMPGGRGESTALHAESVDRAITRVAASLSPELRAIRRR
jgi:VCBS repeat-containing protein